ncbi:hypothetical protein RND81_06G120000 [Saponaria officinalis]|uniref:F-box associated domain-containing protein n=1 Tax=Saponaria officinalis TaxID=3572 RepID=A0AAW1KAN1_SAPOF
MRLRVKMSGDSVNLISGWGWSKGLMIHFNNNPIYSPKNLSCSRLPRLVNKGLPRNLTVVGACNDLLLYMYQRHEDKFDYRKFELYICNAQTKQCLALPSLDLPSMTRNIGNIGFMCDPCYSRDASSNWSLDETFCACIIFIPYITGEVSKLPAYLLSPYTGGVWREVILSSPLRCELLCKCPITSIGRKLHVPCYGCLNGFDPFVDWSNGTSKDIVIQCDSIPTPPCLVTMIVFFGVFHEQLYMCDREDSGRYRVWVLKDYVTGEWSLRHNIMGQDWIPRDLHLVKLINRRPLFGNTIGFHPATPDVIYVLCKRWIVLCNLATKEMEIATKLPKSSYDLFPGSYPFQITFPVWPTPLPILA